MSKSIEEMKEIIKNPYFQIIQEVSGFYFLKGLGAIDDDSTNKMIKELKKKFDVVYTTDETEAKA